MNLDKWDTLLLETSPADVCITFQEKSGFFPQVGDNKTNEPDNKEESAKECEEGENEEITWSKALEMADKLKVYCPRKGIPEVHPEVPSIWNKVKFLFIAISGICLGIFENSHGNHQATPEPMCLPSMRQAGLEHLTQCISLCYALRHRADKHIK